MAPVPRNSSTPREGRDYPRLVLRLCLVIQDGYKDNDEGVPLIFFPQFQPELILKGAASFYVFFRSVILQDCLYSSPLPQSQHLVSHSSYRRLSAPFQGEV